MTGVVRHFLWVPISSASRYICTYGVSVFPYSVHSCRAAATINVGLVTSVVECNSLLVSVRYMGQIMMQIQQVVVAAFDPNP